MTTQIIEGVVGGVGGSTVLTPETTITVITTSPLQGTLQTRTQAITDTTRKRIVFDPPINGMSVKVRHADSTSITADQGILLTVDAVDTTVADANLDESQTGVRLNVMPDDTLQEFVFEGSLVSNIDLKGVGTAPDLVVTLGGIY